MESSLALKEPPNSIWEYATESARPLVSMAFITPLLFIYELGVVVLGPHALRNGADTWLRHVLELIGFGQYLLLPILTCGILLAWHHTRRDSWSMRSGVLITMLMESIFLALVLFGLAHLHQAAFAPATTSISCRQIAPDSTEPQGFYGPAKSNACHGNRNSDGAASLPTCQTKTEPTAGTLSRVIGYCGAGIYEELLFRLMMLPSIAGLLKWLGLPWRASLGWAIVATSLLFSAAHYQLFAPGGYSFDWFSFSFRFAAGLFFALLFVMRGFGITAGSHALYDILVEVS